MSRAASVCLLLLSLAVAPSVGAQCSLEDCAIDCQGGCPDAWPVAHLSLLGRFNLQNTAFETLTSGDGVQPPLRFWAHDAFATANSGCADPFAARPWMTNEYLDFGIGVSGDWILYAADWAGPSGPMRDTIDGCVEAAPTRRSTAEMSWADVRSGEGTADHDAWYLIGSVPVDGTMFDFDQLQGGDLIGGDSPPHYPIQSVPDVTSVGGLSTCTDDTVKAAGTPNAVDPAFFDYTVELETTSPVWLTEAGLNATPALIAGLQVVYTSSGGPPTSSLIGWQPARDPADPATNVAAVVPWGAATTVVISLPAAGNRKWFGVRIVYLDASVNAQLGAGPEATAPRLVSAVGKSCGPAWEGTLAIDPPRGSDDGSVRVRVDAAAATPEFDAGTSVSLERAGEADIVGTDVVLDSDPRTIRATLDLTGVALGEWDVVTVDSDTTTRRLLDGFEVREPEPGFPRLLPRIDLRVQSRCFRPGQKNGVHLQYCNRGRVDANGFVVWVGGLPTDVTWELVTQLVEPALLPGQGPLDWTDVAIEIEETGEVLLPLFVPYLPAWTCSESILWLDVPDERDFDLRLWTAPPYLQTTKLEDDPKQCWSAAVRQGTSAALARLLGTTLPASCAAAVPGDVAALFEATVDKTRTPMTYDDVVAQVHAMIGLIEQTGRCADPAFDFDPIDLEPDGQEAMRLLGDGPLALPDCGPDPSDIYSRTICTRWSIDPNTKTGVAGVGAERWVRGPDTLTYTVPFENLASASAAAREVSVSDALPAELDPSTLRITGVGIGARRHLLPEPAAAAATRVDLRPDRALLVDVAAQVDTNGELTVTFATLDPTTGLPPSDPLVGFLPPNLNAPEGQGWIAFAIDPVADLATGTTIDNSAAIVFDANPAIVTPAWRNTIDATPPVVTLSTPATAAACGFELSWSASDAESGLGDVTIEVQVDAGDWSVWLDRSTGDAATFHGQPGRTYGLRATARDRVGNLATSAESVTAVDPTASSPAPVLAANALRVVKGVGTLVVSGGAVLEGVEAALYRDSSPSGAFEELLEVWPVSPGEVTVLDPAATTYLEAHARSACGERSAR